MNHITPTVLLQIQTLKIKLDSLDLKFTLNKKPFVTNPLLYTPLNILISLFHIKKALTLTLVNATLYIFLKMINLTNTLLKANKLVVDLSKTTTNFSSLH